MKTKILAFIVACVWFVGAVHAGTIELASGGDIGAAIKSLGSGGGTVHCASNGTYAGVDIEGTGYGGTAANPIRVIAGTGDWRTSGVKINKPTSQGNGVYIYQTKGYISFEGFNFSGFSGKVMLANGSPGIKFVNNRVTGGHTCIFSNMCPGIIIQGNTVSGATDEHGIYVNGSDGYTIQSNVCFGNNWDGIHTNIQDNTPGSKNNNGLLEANTCYSNGQAGFDLTSVTNSTIRNNIAYGNQSHGIVLQDITAINAGPCHDNVIVNNTFDASGARWAIAFGGPDYGKNATNTTIFNNICFGDSGSVGVSDSSGVPIVSTCKISNQISAKPQFVGTHDYHLKAGSSAIDLGAKTFNGINAPVTDADGFSRPVGITWDIGAYEYGSGPVVVPPVTQPAPPTNITRTPAMEQAAGDANGDGRVDLFDLTTVTNNWQKVYNPQTGKYEK